jgi:hypothetical protein
MISYSESNLLIAVFLANENTRQFEPNKSKENTQIESLEENTSNVTVIVIMRWQEYKLCLNVLPCRN